jgi:tight adherence protein C
VVDPFAILLSTASFVTVVLVIWAVFREPIEVDPPTNRRIAMALGVYSRQSVFELQVIGQLMNLLLLVARRFPFLRQSIRRDLEASGNPSAYSVEEYLAICLGCALLLTMVCAAFVGPMGAFGVTLTVIAPFVGFAAPLWALRNTARRRCAMIGKQLPYTLDLVAILIEAGATFDQAIGTLIRDQPDDQLNQELALVQAEMIFGTPRNRALRNLADRIPVGSLRSVVGAVNQAEALGTPLSAILKTQSTMLRNQRSVRAEEASAKASMRILLPSMLILFAVVLVVFAPLVLSWMRGELF